MQIEASIASLSFKELETIKAIFGIEMNVVSYAAVGHTAVPYLIDHDPESGIYFRVFRTHEGTMTDTGYDVNIARSETPDDSRPAIRLTETNGYFVDEFATPEAALAYVARHGARV